MATRTAEERAHALNLLTNGTTLADTHRQTGIPKSTLSGWARDAGLDLARSTEKTVQATKASLEVRRARLASSLMDDADRLRRQLFAPCVEKRAMTVSDGQLRGSHVEVVEIERDQPTFAEQAKIMVSLGIAVDKLQLLTGQATERVEHVAPERTPDQEHELAQVLELVRDTAA